MPTPMLHRHPNNFENSIVSATKNKKLQIYIHLCNKYMQCYGYVFAYHNHTQKPALFFSLSLSMSLSLSLLLSHAHLINEI